MTKKVLLCRKKDIKVLADDVTDEMINNYNQVIDFLHMYTNDVKDAEVLTAEDINSFSTRKVSEESDSLDNVRVPIVKVRIPEMDMLEWDKDLKLKDPIFHLTFYPMYRIMNMSTNQLSTAIAYIPDYNVQRIYCAGVINVLHVYDNHYIQIDSKAYKRDYSTMFDHRATILDKYDSLKDIDDKFTDISACMKFYKTFAKQLQETYNVSLYKKIIDETIPKIEEMLNKDENFDFKTLKENDKFYYGQNTKYPITQ